MMFRNRLNVNGHEKLEVGDSLGCVVCAYGGGRESRIYSLKTTLSPLPPSSLSVVLLVLSFLFLVASLCSWVSAPRTSTFCPVSLSTHLSRSFGQHARFCECSCLCDIDRCCLILLPHFVQTLVQFSQRHTISWRLSLERRKIDLGNPRFRLQMPVNDPLAHFPPSPPLPLAQKVIAVPDMLPLFRHLNLTVAIIFLSSLAFTGIRTSSIFLGQKMTKR